VDRYLLPAHKLRQATDVGRRDRQTDERTDTRSLHKPCAAYISDSVNNAQPIGPTASHGISLKHQKYNEQEKFHCLMTPGRPGDVRKSKCLKLMDHTFDGYSALSAEHV